MVKSGVRLRIAYQYLLPTFGEKYDLAGLHLRICEPTTNQILMMQDLIVQT